MTKLKKIVILLMCMFFIISNFCFIASNKKAWAKIKELDKANVLMVSELQKEKKQAEEYSKELSNTKKECEKYKKLYEKEARVVEFNK